jgi:hypothetical protein
MGAMTARRYSLITMPISGFIQAMGCSRTRSRIHKSSILLRIDDRISFDIAEEELPCGDDVLVIPDSEMSCDLHRDTIALSLRDHHHIKRVGLLGESFRCCPGAVGLIYGILGLAPWRDASVVVGAPPASDAKQREALALGVPRRCVAQSQPGLYLSRQWRCRNPEEVAGPMGQSVLIIGKIGECLLDLALAARPDGLPVRLCAVTRRTNSRAICSICFRR